MASRSLSVLVLVCFAVMVASRPVPLPVGRSIARENYRQKLFHEHAAAFESSSPASITQKWYTQILDHFEITQSTQNTTWQQRYWINDQYWNGSGPIFVQFGEEGAASADYVSHMAMVNYGAPHGALLVAIEHRGYGESLATPSLATEYMKYISVDQAMADFAKVIGSIKAEYKAEDAKVVVFGCSYIGAGVSWFRAKYGHVAVGAVASSPPTQAVVDFVKYLEQVGTDLSTFVGPQCNAALRNATTQIAGLLQTAAGTKRVETLFNSCEPLSGPKDVMTFWSNVIGSPWMGSVQYYNESPTIPTMADMCDELLTGGADPLMGFVATFNKYGAAPNGQCLDNSYASMITGLRNTTQPSTGVGDRTWTWQTCSQFGYFQSTDSETQPFGDGLPVTFYADMCRDVFGVDFNLQQNIDNSNIKFGGNQLPPYAVSNVAFDGTADGVWETLAPQKAVNPTCPLFTYTSEGHCAGVFPLTPGMPADIKAVQKQVAATINKWV